VLEIREHTIRSHCAFVVTRHLDILCLMLSKLYGSIEAVACLNIQLSIVNLPGKHYKHLRDFILKRITNSFVLFSKKILYIST
jgi:hypothetical protein